MDLGHCVILGAKYCKDFVGRVKWYYISEETDEYLERLRRKQPRSIRVEFYGERK